MIGPNHRGFATSIGSAFEMGLGDTSCVSCGQCIAVCPTGALQEKDYIDEVLEAIADPEKPLEVVRTIHSFDPCMACAVHVVDADGNEVVSVKVL